MTTRLHELSAAGASQIGPSDICIIARPSTSVTLSGTTISAAASDQSLNDSADGLVAAGFVVGDSVLVQGFVNGVNNIFTGRLTSVAAGKIIVSAAGSPIVDEAAGATVTISKWETRRQNLSNLLIKPFQFAASDEVTALTVATDLIKLRSPFAMTLTAVRASLTVGQTSGTILTVDINVNGSSILSTPLTFDNTARTTVGATTPAVISDPDIPDDAEISVDIDQIGDGTAKGLKILLLGY